MANGTPVGNMIIKVDLDAVGVEKSMTGLQRQLKSSNKAMGAQLSAFDRSGKSASKYGVLIDGLTNRHKIQAKMVEEASVRYKNMSSEYGENSVKAQQAAQSLNEQISRYQETGRELNSLTAEFKEFQRVQDIQSKGWYKVADGMENWGGKLKTAGKTMDNVGGKMTKSITLPAVGAATAVGGIVAAFGWGRLVAMDKAQAKLKGLGIEGKKLDETMKTVKEAVKGTTMTMAEGADISAGALAAGVKEGKELEKYIKLVGNAALGANRPIGDMAMIFHRVQGAGKVMTDELNSIESGMPGFSKAMSKHLGVSTEKMREMVTNGKVTSKDFLKVMDGFAGGMAKEYAKTWDGMVSNTKANVGIIGESFLKGVFQDSKKSLADFIELLKNPDIQRRAEEMGEVARKSFAKMKESIMSVVDWYKNLDDGQKTMLKRIGLIAVVGGPVLQFAGKFTDGLGSVLLATGKLSKAVGLSKGVGLLGSLTSLGPLAVGGVAVAGLVAVGAAVYKATKESEELEEINLDVAKSLSNQSVELENSANMFDKLTNKATLSNDQLAQLNDLNIRISKSSNPGEINELQKQYDALAEKSGLSKDELKALFKANENIVEQTPQVKKSVSDQGNAFAENTEAVKEYISSLHEATLIELEGERLKALENEVKLNKEKTKQQKELNSLLSEMGMYNDEIKMSESDRKDRIEEINELYRDMSISDAEKAELMEEQVRLANIQSGHYVEMLDDLNTQIEKKRESIKGTDDELALIKELDMKMADIVLKQIGINEEGEKGLAKLDESLIKNGEELAKLDEKLEKNGKLNEEEKSRYDTLVALNEKHSEAKEYLFEELGIYKDLNSLVEGRLTQADTETQKKVTSLAKTAEIKVEEGKVLDQIQKKNTEYDKGIDKLIEQKKEEGANKQEIDKQISALETKKSKNNEVIKKVLEELGVWKDLDESIKDGIDSEIRKGGVVDGTKNKLDSQGDSIDKNNQKTELGIKKEEERSKEAGKDVDKDVDVKDNGTIADLNKKAIEEKNKVVNLKAKGVAEVNRVASSPVTKTIKLVAKAAGYAKNIMGYAASTSYKEDAMVIIGGSEE